MQVRAMADPHNAARGSMKGGDWTLEIAFGHGGTYRRGSRVVESFATTPSLRGARMYIAERRRKRQAGRCRTLARAEKSASFKN